MSVDLLPVLRPVRVPWNKGRIIGQKRPLMPRHVWSIRVRLEMAGNARDLALFNMAVDSKLRGCDLVSLRVRDVFAAGRVKERTSMIQSKTGKPVRFEITETTPVVARSMDIRPRNDWPRVSMAQPDPRQPPPVDAAVCADRPRLGDVARVGAERLRHAFHCDGPRSRRSTRKTGNLRAVQLLLGHTKMDSTVRYLGVDIEDALSLSEGIDL